jgi:NADH dehydrogenase FAD-containing subunit
MFLILIHNPENARLQAAETVLIIGGGPVGVELAGEIATDFPNKKVLYSRKSTYSYGSAS